MAFRPTYPLIWDTPGISFTAANGTQAKILVDTTPAGVMSTISAPTAETALPGEATVRQRILEGGCRILGGHITSTDTARSILLYVGRLIATLPAGTNTITTQNVITRATGSFLTDPVGPFGSGLGANRPISIGDTIMIFDSATSANNGVVAQVTGITATTITVNGAPFTNDSNMGQARIFRVQQRTRKAVPANAGNADATPPVALLGGAQDVDLAAQPDTGLQLGPNSIVAMALLAAVSVLPARIDVTAHVGMY